MRLCASASVSPWPCTDQTPALEEVPRDAYGAARGPDGAADSTTDVQDSPATAQLNIHHDPSWQQLILVDRCDV